MIVRHGDTPTTRGGAMMAGAVAFAMESISAIMTSTAVTIADSVALSVMVSPTMMTTGTMGTMAGDAVGCTAER
jgi:hypothetical protein